MRSKTVSCSIEKYCRKPFLEVNVVRACSGTGFDLHSSFEGLQFLKSELNMQERTWAIRCLPWTLAVLTTLQGELLRVCLVQLLAARVWVGIRHHGGAGFAFGANCLRNLFYFSISGHHCKERTRFFCSLCEIKKSPGGHIATV